MLCAVLQLEKIIITAVVFKAVLKYERPFKSFLILQIHFLKSVEKEQAPRIYCTKQTRKKTKSLYFWTGRQTFV